MFEVETSEWVERAITRVRMAKTLLGRPAHEVSAYAVGDLLVDTGPPATASRLRAWCREQGTRVVVLTHHHEDHVGGAAALAAEPGVRVLAPPTAIPFLAEGLRMPPYRRVVWGTPRRFRAEPLDERVRGGGLDLRVVPTPGHAATHVCLWEPERRWLFSGDLYVHPRVRYLRRIEDVAAHLDSLRRVLALDPEVMICAHAGIVEDAASALREKIDWWEELGGRARELAARGWSDRRISHELLGREGFLAYASLGDFSKLNLVRSLLGRL